MTNTDIMTVHHARAVLDHCYTTYRRLPYLGNTDYLILLCPKCRPLVQRQKEKMITVKKWSNDTMGELMGVTHLHNLTESVCGYIDICTDAITERQVKVLLTLKRG